MKKNSKKAVIIDFCLPCDRSSNSNLIKYIDRTFIDFHNYIYQNAMEFLTNEDRANLKDIGNKIVTSLCEYYKGNPANAYKILSEVLDRYIIEFDYEFTKEERKIQRDVFGTYERSIKENFFRVRYSNYNILEKKELLHIPFNLRFEKVSNQRYSINSFPCLYLSDSLFVCWNELGKPNFNNLHCSMFKFDNSKIILNLGIESIKNDISNKIKDLKKKIYTWQLAFVCTIKVKDRSQRSYPEYILPQLLLQWVKNRKDVFGIKYISTMIDQEGKLYNKKFNLVIPTRIKKIKSGYKNEHDKYCPELLKSVEMTEPISWMFLDLSNPSYVSSNIEENNKVLADIQAHKKGMQGYILSANDIAEKEYEISKFGQLEKYIEKQEIKKIIFKM